MRMSWWLAESEMDPCGDGGRGVGAPGEATSPSEMDPCGDGGAHQRALLYLGESETNS